MIVYAIDATWERKGDSYCAVVVGMGVDVKVWVRPIEPTNGRNWVVEYGYPGWCVSGHAFTKTLRAAKEIGEMLIEQMLQPVLKLVAERSL